VRHESGSKKHRWYRMEKTGRQGDSGISAVPPEEVAESEEEDVITRSGPSRGRHR